MTLPWYWPLVQDLTKHIQDEHMDQDSAMTEVDFAEEHLHYESFKDNEYVSLQCPWSEHCSCDWKVTGHLQFVLIETKSKE